MIGAGRRPAAAWRRIATPLASVTLAALALVWPTLGAPASATAGAPAPAPLESELDRIAASLGGRVGVAAVHVETGWRLALLGSERFPMASVYKFPIALAVLDRVERGEMRLADSTYLRRSDLRPGRGALALPAGADGMRVRVARLLELMVGESDNTASDALLRLAGGPAAVTRRLRELGIAGIHVSRYEVQLMADWSGARSLPPATTWTPERLDSLFAAVPAATRQAAARRFAADPRDTATPAAMADLLVAFDRGQALSPSGTALLRGIMERTRTGPARLRGRLPRRTPVAHKTGTIAASVTNDVGLVTLPGGRGHLAIAVFVQDSPRPLVRREQGIAEIARAVYDFVLAQPQ